MAMEKGQVLAFLLLLPSCCLFILFIYTNQDLLSVGDTSHGVVEDATTSVINQGIDLQTFPQETVPRLGFSFPS